MQWMMASSSDARIRGERSPIMLIPLCVATVLMAVAMVAGRAYARVHAGASKQKSVSQGGPPPAGKVAFPLARNGADKSLVKWPARQSSATY